MKFIYKNKTIIINLNNNDNKITIQDLQYQILKFTNINPSNQILYIKDKCNNNDNSNNKSNKIIFLKEYLNRSSQSVSSIIDNSLINDQLQYIEIQKYNNSNNKNNNSSNNNNSRSHDQQIDDYERYSSNFFKVFRNKYLLRLISSKLHFECGGCNGLNCYHYHNSHQIYNKQIKNNINNNNNYNNSSSDSSNSGSIKNIGNHHLIYMKYKKYNEILDIGWMIQNGYYSLLRYKFKRNELIYNYSTKAITKLIKNINNPNNTQQENNENIIIIKFMYNQYQYFFNSKVIEKVSKYGNLKLFKYLILNQQQEQNNNGIGTDIGHGNINNIDIGSGNGSNIGIGCGNNIDIGSGGDSVNNIDIGTNSHSIRDHFIKYDLNSTINSCISGMGNSLNYNSNQFKIMDMLFSLNNIKFGNHINNNRLLRFDQFIITASKYQNLQVIKYLFKYNNGCINYNSNTQLLVNTSINGNIEIWRYLTTSSLSSSDSSIRICDTQYNKSIKELITVEVLSNLCKYGHIEILNLIIQQYKLSVYINEDKVLFNNQIKINNNQDHHNNNNRNDSSSSSDRIIVYNGEFEMLLINSIENGHIQILELLLQYISDKKLLPRYLIDTAVKFKQVEIFKLFLFKFKLIVTEKTFESACEVGSIEIIEILIKNGYMANERSIVLANNNNHFNCLAYLISSCKIRPVEVSSLFCLYWSCKYGYLNIIQASNIYSLSNKTTDWASSFGRVNIVQFLCEKGHHGTIKSFKSAYINNNLSLLNVLFNYHKLIMIDKSSFKKLIVSNHFDIIKFLLKYEQYIVFYKKNNNQNQNHNNNNQHNNSNQIYNSKLKLLKLVQNNNIKKEKKSILDKISFLNGPDNNSGYVATNQSLSKLSNKLIDISILCGNINILQYLIQHFKVVTFTSSSIAYSVYGNFKSIFKYLINFSSTDNINNNNNNNNNTITTNHNNKLLSSKSIILSIETSIKYNRLDLLQILIEHLINSNSALTVYELYPCGEKKMVYDYIKFIDEASNYDNYEIVNYLIDNRFKISDTSITNVIKVQNFNILSCFNKHYNLNNINKNK